MVRQYGASHNADAVFTAYSLVRADGGQVIQVDEKLHDPIVQELGIIAGTAHLDAARKMAAFLRAGGGRDLLLAAGYRLP
jgi:ABC-type molybdate transport system substrate-binding protein